MKQNNQPFSIKTTHQLLANKKLSVQELCGQYFAAAQKLNPKTNAYITLAGEKTRQSQIKKAQKAFDAKTASPLTGIPFCMKDAYLTRRVATTSASHVLKDYQPQYSSTVYNKMLEQNAVLVGKNNQDAWGHGGSSENTDYGTVHNPWDLDRTAGGSSGGSAAALATDTSIFAIGEDTGGSIRNPASFNNTCGLKVTYGRVSRYGAIAYASSLDTVGPMANCVEDLAFVLNHMAGFDPKDASSSHEAVPNYTQNLDQPIKGTKIGILKEYFQEGLQPEVKEIIQKAIKELEDQGAQIVEVSLPTVKYGVSIYYVIALSETSSNLARFDSVRYGQSRNLFTEETKRRILSGTFSLSSGYYDAYYKTALKARTKLIQEFENTFQKVDALIAPVMPFSAYQLGEAPIGEDLVTAMYLADLYTCATNPAGVPSLALPAGFTKDNLPVGMQLIGPMFSEEKLLQIGHQYQQTTDWHTRRPKV